MIFYDGGYSRVQFNNQLLRACAANIAAKLPDIMAVTGAEAVVVCGKSGIALAFATQMLIDFPLIVVRKQGESTHGSPIEGTPNMDISKYLILDDFVASGATVRSIAQRLTEHVQYAGKVSDSLVCVGVVEYATQDQGYAPSPATLNGGTVERYYIADKASYAG